MNILELESILNSEDFKNALAMHLDLKSLIQTDVMFIMNHNQLSASWVFTYAGHTFARRLGKTIFNAPVEALQSPITIQVDGEDYMFWFDTDVQRFVLRKFTVEIHQQLVYGLRFPADVLEQKNFYSAILGKDITSLKMEYVRDSIREIMSHRYDLANYLAQKGVTLLQLKAPNNLDLQVLLTFNGKSYSLVARTTDRSQIYSYDELLMNLELSIKPLTMCIPSPIAGDVSAS